MLPEASIPGPVSVTAGPGTNSYGAFLSATGGGNGADATTSPGNPGTHGTPGTGSGGQLNFPGAYGTCENSDQDNRHLQVLCWNCWIWKYQEQLEHAGPGVTPGQARLKDTNMGGGGGGSPSPANPNSRS
jgi:hypothetical protein